MLQDLGIRSSPDCFLSFWVVVVVVVVVAVVVGDCAAVNRAAKPVLEGMVACLVDAGTTHPLSCLKITQNNFS